MRQRPSLSAFSLLALGFALALPASAQEDTGPATPSFKEGDVISIDKIESLKPFLPPEFWSNRDFFFYEGMKLEVGPFYRDYTPADAYQAASAKFAGQSKVGPGASLGEPHRGPALPDGQDRLQGRPARRARRSSGTSTTSGTGTAPSPATTTRTGTAARSCPLYYEGTAKTIQMSHRVEPEYLDKQDGDLFRGEKRKSAFGIEVDAPFDARGILVMTYRYKDADNATAKTKNDDTWVYVPTLRRVRRISSAQRTDAVSGTDFTFDDLRSFAGIVPQYTWECLGEMDIIAPMNSKVAAYPYKKDHNFGPYGLSYADDRWELRHAVKIRFMPNNAGPPVPPQGHLHRQADAGRALQLRLRPEGRAVEDHLAQPPLERGQPPRGQGRLVRRLGGRAPGRATCAASATRSSTCRPARGTASSSGTPTARRCRARARSAATSTSAG